MASVSSAESCPNSLHLISLRRLLIFRESSHAENQRYTMKTAQCSGSADEGAIKDYIINTFPASQACAACKFQRRRCSADCPLAPYFPANRRQEFQNVRRLFGVRNVLKTLGHLDLSRRFLAAECMIFEANCRARDLAGGCYRIIASLQHEITLLEAQRQQVFLQLRTCRQTTAAAAGLHGGPFRSEFCCKPGLSSLLHDCSESASFDDRILKEICSLNGVDFNCR